MTRRERLLAKLEKRHEWAVKRSASSSVNIQRAIDMVKCIPMGQPILIGHHSERRHRALLARSDGAMRRGSEDAAMAEHHSSKAAGLEAQIEGSIFSDDPDAVDALNARIAELEAKREGMKKANAAYRKGGAAGLREVMGEEAVAAFARLQATCPYERAPFPSYSLSNLSGNIARLRKRLEQVTVRAQRMEKAATAQDGVIVEGTGVYVRITFAEKPSRDILSALRAADFRWGGGSWTGERAKIPAGIQAA